MYEVDEQDMAKYIHKKLKKDGKLIGLTFIKEILELEMDYLVEKGFAHEIGDEDE